ncbi:carbohydrate kinase family protein [Pseudomonas segetis]|uniref:Fructokinase n=1 Tax=Pseudomonas segetis TaxID=298908 RepID=A0A239FCU9_9PSED|nr:carbohydrate kinase [Pseudomonas segetis]SNS53982.1 fructokinase [Pseudomonas segetis]
MYLVCGEALFDFFSVEPSPRNGEVAFKAVAGGSPFNVAIGLRRLGAEAALFTGISTDYLGLRLRKVLADEGVVDQYLVGSDAPTTLAMVGLDQQGSPQYSFRGEGCADRQLYSENLPQLDPQVRGIHIGSYSLVVLPVADTLLELIKDQPAQRLISYDPNVRLNPQPDKALWRLSVETFVNYAHMIKVSDEDLDLLYPGQEPQALVNSWLSERCQLVFLTRGQQGASVFSYQHGHWSVPAASVPIRDTVGAGDTFQAALLAYLQRNQLDSPRALANIRREQIDAMLKLAVRAAAITCSRTGPDLPLLAEVEGL